MTYANNRANKFSVKGHTVLLNIQHSSIGYAYPRVFFEATSGEYVNFDLTVNAFFKMKEKDWNDWLSDCEEITTDEAKEALKDYVNWGPFERMFENM